MLSNLNFFEQIADEIVKPRPCHYMNQDIWKEINDRNKLQYEFLSFEHSDRKINLHLVSAKESFDLHTPKSLEFKQSVCIVYLHGLSSFAVQGSYLIKHVEEFSSENVNLSICLYDLRGHGRDRAETITYGVEESKQLCKCDMKTVQILKEVKDQKQVTQFILWGRSMGATTVLKMMEQYQSQLRLQGISIVSLIVDSAFCSFEKIAFQLISKHTGIPQILSQGVLSHLTASIQKKTQTGIAVQFGKNIKLETKVTFLYSECDNLISPLHTEKLYQICDCQSKEKIEIGVGHNEQRPLSVIKKIFQNIFEKTVIKRDIFRQSPKMRRSSVSAKKGGLSMTKHQSEAMTPRSQLKQKLKIHSPAAKPQIQSFVTDYANCSSVGSPKQSPFASTPKGYQAYVEGKKPGLCLKSSKNNHQQSAQASKSIHKIGVKKLRISSTWKSQAKGELVDARRGQQNEVTPQVMSLQDSLGGEMPKGRRERTSIYESAPRKTNAENQFTLSNGEFTEVRSTVLQKNEQTLRSAVGQDVSKAEQKSGNRNYGSQITIEKGYFPSQFSDVTNISTSIGKKSEVKSKKKIELYSSQIRDKNLSQKNIKLGSSNIKIGIRKQDRKQNAIGAQKIAKTPNFPHKAEIRNATEVRNLTNRFYF